MSALYSLIEKGTAVAENSDSANYPDLLDILKISLTKAQNGEVSAYSTQEKIDSIYQLLLNAVEAFNNLIGYQKGDVDHSGSVNILDATLIQRYLVHLLPSEQIFDNKLADMNDDGKISIFDATRIQVMLAK